MQYCEENIEKTWKEEDGQDDDDGFSVVHYDDGSADEDEHEKEEGRRRTNTKNTVTHADGWLIVVAGIASVCDLGEVIHSILDVRLSHLRPGAPTPVEA